jgi:hypothetical protein
MYRISPSQWAQLIPPAKEEGAFVRYLVRAEDDAGAVVSSPLSQFRVFEDGIASIADIQTTFDGGPGDSPFAGLRVSMDLVGTVQSDPAKSGLVAIQDDTLKQAWSGIMLDPDVLAQIRLRPGDLIRITRASVEERAGQTYLNDLELRRLVRSLGRIEYKSVSTRTLSESSGAEAHEGMLLRLEDVSVAGDWGGEWTVTNAAFGDTIRVSAQSPAVADGAMSLWENRPFMKGIWVQSDLDWKLVPESEEDLGPVTNTRAEWPESHTSGPGVLTSVYPNPASDRVRARFETAVSGAAEIVLFDITGRRLALLWEGMVTGGTHVIPFSVEEFSPGSYVVSLRAGKRASQTLLMVL